MALASKVIADIKHGQYDSNLLALSISKDQLSYQKKRYRAAIESFMKLYGDQEISIFSAPGRSEVGGNHTDHQHGRVLAVAINLDIIGVVSKRDDGIIKIVSDQYDIDPVSIDDLSKDENEFGTSKALVKGVSQRVKECNYQIGGFNGFFTSEVLVGSGMSSSAAFEVLVGTILSGLYNDGSIDPVLVAQIGQYAENEYFGKPCGLMDQCASAVGSLITIDFKDTTHPEVEKVDVDFSKFHHSLCIVDTKGSHADLTDDYAAIPSEMKHVASCFNKEFLREVDEDEFYQKLPELLTTCHDREILRAIHLFEENKRVVKEVDALNKEDFASFKEAFIASGDSSYKYLQNVYTSKDVKNQSVSLALCLSQKFLGDHGVSRVHGGGFAGTIQAFVEDDYVAEYKQKIEQVFGEESCHVLQVRSIGGTKVL